MTRIAIFKTDKRAGDRRGAAGVAGDCGVIAQWVARLKTELAAPAWLAWLL